MRSLLLTSLLIFAMPAAQASYLIEKRCMTSLSAHKSKAQRKKICSCVDNNLQSKLSGEQIQALEKIYKDRHSRINASRDEKLKPIVDLDFEITKNCSLNSQWRLPVEDLGTPDPL